MIPLFLRAAAGFGGCLQASVQVKQRGIEETTAAGMADDKFAKRPTLHRNLRFFRNSKKGSCYRICSRIRDVVLELAGVYLLWTASNL